MDVRVLPLESLSDGGIDYWIYHSLLALRTAVRFVVLHVVSCSVGTA